MKAIKKAKIEEERPLILNTLEQRVEALEKVVKDNAAQIKNLKKIKQLEELKELLKKQNIEYRIQCLEEDIEQTSLVVKELRIMAEMIGVNHFSDILEHNSSNIMLFSQIQTKNPDESTLFPISPTYSPQPSLLATYIEEEDTYEYNILSERRGLGI